MQNLIHRYHGLDTSRAHNARFIETVRTGVYSGFKLRVNPGYLDRIDIVRGNAFRSVLVTSEGVIVEETGDLPNAVRIDPADSLYTRIDLVVCEYQFTPDTQVPAVYKVIRGKNQATTSTDPVPPSPQNDYQVPLGQIVVRPQIPLGGMAQVRISQTDVLVVPEADFTLASDMGALKPDFDYTNTKRIFVYAGVFPNSDQTGVIRFMGGYSEAIDDSSMLEDEVRYFLFGISDDEEVSVVSSSSDPDALTGYGTDILPLAIAKVQKTGGIGRILELTDVRFPFARQVTSQGEDLSYRMALDTSVFSYVRVDTFATTDLIDLTTKAGPTGADTLLLAKIDRSDTSLTLEWTGTTDPDDDVLITTENLLNGTPISLVTNVMLVIDSDIENLSYEYSTVSKYSGFTNQRFSNGRIITISGGGGSRLYIRFRIPKDVFAISSIQKIYSYGAFLNYDVETLNQRVIAELGISNLANSAIPNLILNGNFRWWNRNNKDGIRPDCDNPEQIDYPVSIDPQSIAAGTDVFAADGWQFTKIQYEGDNRIISRIIFSEAAQGSSFADAIDTGLKWQGESGEETLVNELEYRIPVTAEMVGNRITFAVDFQTTIRAALGIAIAFYSRDETGKYTMMGTRSEMGAADLKGTIIVESNAAVSESTYAVGCIIMLPQVSALQSTVFVHNARAAVGSYKELPYTYDPQSKTLLRAYYERGRAVASGEFREGDDVAVSAQFGAVKHIGLSKDSQIVARIVSGTSANQSLNVESPVLTASDNGLVITGTAITSGFSKIDVEWEAFVLYPTIE